MSPRPRLPLTPAAWRDALARHPGIGRALRNVSWLTTDRLLQMVVGLTVGLWVARYLGPERFGVLSYALAIVAIFTAFSSMGLEAIVVRDLVQRPREAGRILGSAAAIQLVGGLVACLASIAVALWLRPRDTTAALIVTILASGLLFRASDVIGYWFEAEVKAKYAVLARNVAFVATAAGKAALVLWAAPLVAFAWIALAGSVLTAAALVVAWRLRGDPASPWRVHGPTVRAQLGQSWPLVLSGFAVMLQARVDQLLLGRLVGDAEVGQYSAAMQLIEVVAFVPVVIAATAAPYIARARALDEALYRDWLTNVYRLMLIVFVALAVPVFLLGGPLVELVLGEPYARAGWLLSLFSLRLFFANFGIAKRLFLTNENLFRYSMLTAVAGMLVNLGLNLLLIPMYRSEGAFVASMVSFGVTIFLFDAWHPVARQNLRLMLTAIATPHRLSVESLEARTGPAPAAPTGIMEDDDGYR